MLASVAIDLALDRLFTYEVPAELAEKLRIGQLLRVPFGHRTARGFALALRGAEPGRGLRGAEPATQDVLPANQGAEPANQDVLPANQDVLPANQGAEPANQDVLPANQDVPPANRDGAGFTIKPILGIEDEAPFFSPPVLELVKWIAGYTCSPIETCLKCAVPGAVLKPNARPKERLFVEPIARPPASALSSGDSDSPSRLLTPYQAELLANLVRVGGGWMQQLCREFKTTAATLRALEARGAVSISQKAQRRDPLAGRSVMPTKPLVLNEMQRAALEKIMASDRPVLLHGVTGSGKTEIYLQAIAKELEAGRGAIVLVPEIALTPQTVRRFAGRFGQQVAVLHSALSDGERYDEWHRIRTGEARVVVGPRSAVFAPVRDLGLIVVDEEHDSSYKQDETPRYHARDVAVMRGHFEKCKVVLGSATPSLETWLNAKKGKYVLASVPARVAGRPMPEVHLVDLEEEREAYGAPPIFSRFLLDAIADRLRKGEQTILFLNRRGYSRALECRECGHVVECPECSVPYTYHLADKCLRCHVCGGWRMEPRSCPACGARDFAYAGIGTQRAESALKKCFHAARIIRMDADSTSRKNTHDDLLSAFRAGKADVLLGTQMIAKGLDFPNVTLVGVLNADTSLNMPDFRAAERTFQLLAQVSGRAGRADKPGEVYVQTFSPDEPAIKAAAACDYCGFAEQELKDREAGFYPPYCRLATFLFRSKEEPAARAWAEMYAQSLKTAKGLKVSDAVPAALERAEGWFRYQVVVRAASAKEIVAACRWITRERPAPKDVRISFDMDAQSLA